MSGSEWSWILGPRSGSMMKWSKALGKTVFTTHKHQTWICLVCQLLGGPIYGRIGDVMGERFAIILAFTSTTLTYLVTGWNILLTQVFYWNVRLNLLFCRVVLQYSNSVLLKDIFCSHACYARYICRSFIKRSRIFL